MWKNIVETNIMIGTHADVLVAEAYLKGFGDLEGVVPSAFAFGSNNSGAKGKTSPEAGRWGEKSQPS